MNTESGNIFEVKEGSPLPKSSVPLTAKERGELRKIVNRTSRLRRYKQMHAADVCKVCNLTLRKHTLQQVQTCSSKGEII